MFNVYIILAVIIMMIIIRAFGHLKVNMTVIACNKFQGKNLHLVHSLCQRK